MRRRTGGALLVAIYAFRGAKQNPDGRARKTWLRLTASTATIRSLVRRWECWWSKTRCVHCILGPYVRPRCRLIEWRRGQRL